MQMKTLGALILVLVIGGLAVLFVSTSGTRGGPGHEPAVAAAPRQVPVPEAELDPVTGREPDGLDEVGAPVGQGKAAREIISPDPAEPVAAAPGELQVRGRFVDGGGAPLSGVELRSEDSRASTTSGVDGRFELALTLEAEEGVALVATLAGYVVLELEPASESITSDRELDLGDLVLMPAGRVTGRVVDEHGIGVGGARVLATTMGPLGWGARGNGPGNGLLETSSEDGGRFELSGLGEGEVRVWAGLEGWWWAYSDAVLVVAGRETGDVELRLEALEPEDVIEFRIVDPQHEPVPHADIYYYYHEGGTSGTGSAKADEEGRYRRVLERRADFDFCARDPEDAYRPAVARGVEPGTTDLVLVLGAPRALAVRVRDTAGAPVAGFSVSSMLVVGERWLSGASATATEQDQEVVVFQLPTETFQLTAKADGYESTTLGPLEPKQTGASIEIELAPLPGIRGRVVDPAGKPVAGAEVGLHEQVSETTSLSVNGFPARSRKGRTAQGETDEEGRFTLTLRESGLFFLRAESDSFAPGELGPLELFPASGAQGLEIALEEGGGIEGELLLSPGRNAAGRVVGVSRGDGYAVTGRTDAKGRFEFQGLTAGPWFVKRCNEEIREGWTSSTSSDGGERRELPWSCDVWPGRTTHFDLDLTQAALVVLEGGLSFSGEPRVEWDVRLARPGDSGAVVADGRLDSQGEFRLELGEEGPFVLRVTGFSDSRFTILEQDVELELGRNEWVRDLAMGRVEGQVATHLLVDENNLSLSWEGPGGLRFSSFSSVGVDGSFHASVPAGDVDVRYGESETLQLRVVEGATARVDLP